MFINYWVTNLIQPRYLITMQTSSRAKMHTSFAFYSQIFRVLNWFSTPSTVKRSFNKASLGAVGPSKSMMLCYEVLKTHLDIKDMMWTSDLLLNRMHATELIC